MGALRITIPSFGIPTEDIVGKALIGSSIRGNVLEVRLVDDINRDDTLIQRAIVESIKAAIRHATTNKCEIFRFWSDCTLRGDEAAALAKFSGRELRLEDLWRVHEPGVLAKLNAFQGRTMPSLV